MVYLRLFAMSATFIVYWYSQFSPWINNTKNGFFSKCTVLGILMNALLVFGICMCKKRIVILLIEKFRIFYMAKKRINNTEASPKGAIDIKPMSNNNDV